MHTAVKFAILLGFSLVRTNNQKTKNGTIFKLLGTYENVRNWLIQVLSPEAQPVEKSCRTVFSELNKKQVELIAECLKQLGYKTVKEKTQKSTCVLKCVMSNLKVLNGNGSVDEGTFNDFVEHQWPHHLQQRAKDAFGPCFTITSEC